MPGLFTGQHEFFLEEKDGITHFVQREDFGGILVPFVDLSGTEAGFKRMNLALKERAESIAIGYIENSERPRKTF